MFEQWNVQIIQNNIIDTKNLIFDSLEMYNYNIYRAWRCLEETVVFAAITYTKRYGGQLYIGEKLECHRKPDNSCDRYSEDYNYYNMKSTKVQTLGGLWQKYWNI